MLGVSLPGSGAEAPAGNKPNVPATKFPVAEGGPGIGLQIRVADLDGNGWKDIVCAGKSGTHILWNQAK